MTVLPVLLLLLAAPVVPIDVPSSSTAASSAAPAGLAPEAPARDPAWVAGHAALGIGAGLAAASTAAFLAGFDVERTLRQAPRDRAAIDALLVQRAVAAGVAWTTATLAAAGVGAGAVLLAVASSSSSSSSAPATEAP
jgi:hypothetical protein